MTRAPSFSPRPQRRLWLLWGPVVLYMALIFWASSRPWPQFLSQTPDFPLHGGAYFVLGVLAVRAVAKGLAEPRGAYELAAGVAITILYGMSDEWHQSVVPGRDASLRDVLADAVGALVGAAVIALWWRMRRARGRTEDPVLDAGGRLT